MSVIGEQAEVAEVAVRCAAEPVGLAELEQVAQGQGIKTTCCEVAWASA